MLQKKHRHTTTATTPDPYKQYGADEYQSSSTTRMYIYIYINFIIILFDLFIYLDFLSQETDEITNRSRRLDPYLFYSFIIGLYSFVQ